MSYCPVRVVGSKVMIDPYLIPDRETSMPLSATRPVLFRFSARTIRFSSGALLLLLALHSESSARTSSPSGHETVLAASARPVFTSASSSQIGTVPAPAAESSLQSVVAEKRIPDWNGIWRDTGILFGSQIVAGGVIYLMPESVSSWSSEQKKNSFNKYADNFVSPGMDKDKFYINYLLHPYWGATYYTRARERGLDKGSSFAFSALISGLFEFGVECFYEKPSIQDLVITPAVGSVIGAFLFEPWRESIKRKEELRWYDHAALIATDPVGVLSSAVEKLFGLKPAIMIEYSVPKVQQGPAGPVTASQSSRVGVVFQFPLN